MHHSTKRRVVLGMTTGGLLLGGVGMGVAQADTAANGGTANSPGVLSGNLIQIPVSIPVNVCGNSVSVVGVGDTAAGNHCQNASGSGSTGSTANGGASNSPGVGSGNTVQTPVSAPVNACGNQISVIGILDSAAGNNCGNGSTPTAPGHPCGCHPTTPPQHTTPPKHVTSTSTSERKPLPTGTLAETGSGASNMLAPLGASVLGGSGLMLRKRVSIAKHATHRP